MLAARRTLPPERSRERKLATVGIVMAAIPLALVILAMVVITGILVISMITGVHCWGSCQS